MLCFTIIDIRSINTVAYLELKYIPMISIPLFLLILPIIIIKDILNIGIYIYIYIYIYRFEVINNSNAHDVLDEDNPLVHGEPYGYFLGDDV